MTRFLPFLLGAALVLAPARARGASPEGAGAALEAALRAIEADSGGTLGVKVVHLESGRSAGRNAEEPFPMASVYKLPIAAAVLAKVEAGELALGQEVEVLPGELRRTGARVDPWTPGSRVAVLRLLDAMMTASDNTACDVLLRVLGGGPAVDAWLAGRGYPGIDVTWSELVMAATASGVEDRVRDGACDHACLDALVAAAPKAKRAAAGRAFEADRRNTATPSDLARFLSGLWSGRLLSAESSGLVLGMMRRNRTGDRRIRALLPEGTPVWDKTGSIGRSANDVGLVELPGGKGTLVVVALVKGSTRDWPARDRAIARAAKAAFDAFAR